MRKAPFVARRPRWGIVALVLLIHIVVIAALVRAFTPQIADRVAQSVMQAFTIDAPVPSPAPSPEPQPKPSSSAAPEKAAEQGAPGRKAVPRAEQAPPAAIPVRPTQAPPIAGAGREDAAGAVVAGTGTGAAGVGNGRGAGGDGDGQGGGGGALPTIKIAGDINSAKDYPHRTRSLRIGASVTIDLTVARDGRVSDCRIFAASPDADADRITCRLAIERFRFRPARDATGSPVVAVYRWRQRWFY